MISSDIEIDSRTFPKGVLIGREILQHVADQSSIGHGDNEPVRQGRKFHKSPTLTEENISGFPVFPPPTVRFNADGSERLRDPLSVVIPAWNCLDLTERCLTALASNADVSPLDIIYVDNGSNPGVVDRVKELAAIVDLPLRTIEFPENRGFCAAANAGMKSAEGRHVLLLNNDCYIERGCLSALMRHLLSDSKVASVGPLTDDHGGQSVARHSNLARRRGKRQSLLRERVSGFCQLKRREAIDEIGYLDENLPHGLGTDDDWCHRARSAGWKILLALDAFAHHDHMSTFKRSGQNRRAMQREAVAYLKQKGTL